ncbi:unnamed protein product [Owenia fusiformis]|uniref:Uncharacterized protein n=1 Tax=Owenia fusiformis TaxID=6347 RepID=A0A8J1YDA3_OWEFU|nr:unnamed protein product [Owenia fusiformis]
MDKQVSVLLIFYILSCSIASIPALGAMSERGNIVKEGWLWLRGEYGKNFKPRYFILMDDGPFKGFIDVQASLTQKPLINFFVEEYKIERTEKFRANTFIMRTFQQNMIIERIFSVESATERESWVETLLSVSRKVRELENEGRGKQPVDESQLFPKELFDE